MSIVRLFLNYPHLWAHDLRYLFEISGTTNFVHGFPFVSVSIGLTIRKEPIIGVIYFPLIHKMYKAIKGIYCYCNDERCIVDPAPSLKDSLILTEVGSDRSDRKKKNVFTNMESVGWQSHGIRCVGSATGGILTVALGQAQAFYEFGLHCWDVCAASVIIKEAGGYVCDTNGGPFNLLNRRIIAACNKTIADELVAALVDQLELPSD